MRILAAVGALAIVGALAVATFFLGGFYSVAGAARTWTSCAGRWSKSARNYR